MDSRTGIVLCVFSMCIPISIACYVTKSAFPLLALIFISEIKLNDSSNKTINKG
jgi:hypothetical protein